MARYPYTVIKIRELAVTSVIAILLFSCKEKLPTTSISYDSELPSQVIEGMTVYQFTNGVTEFIVNAPKMERFPEAEPSYDLFPEGIMLRGYTPEGLLETKIEADFAKNIVRDGQEIWEAYGNVVINNYLKGEKMETDTLYWDRLSQRIYTHTLVKMTTPDLFMQGYGMESDEMARNAVINNPFDSYAIIQKDSTEVGYIDTANFIGPRLIKTIIPN